MESAGVLDQGALPREWHREEHRIEPRVIEPFADVAAGRDHEARLVVRDGCQSRRGGPPFSRCHAAVEGDQMVSYTPKAGGKGLKMVLAFGEQDRRAAFSQRGRDVIQDETVALLVGCQRGVERLYAVDGHRATGAECGLTDDQPQMERPPSRLAPSVDGKAHRAKLHL